MLQKEAVKRVRLNAPLSRAEIAPSSRCFEAGGDRWPAAGSVTTDSEVFRTDASGWTLSESGS
jgi:hypothetical protein